MPPQLVYTSHHKVCAIAIPVIHYKAGQQDLNRTCYYAHLFSCWCSELGLNPLRLCFSFILPKSASLFYSDMRSNPCLKQICSHVFRKSKSTLSVAVYS